MRRRRTGPGPSALRAGLEGPAHARNCLGCPWYALPGLTIARLAGHCHPVFSESIWLASRWRIRCASRARPAGHTSRSAVPAMVSDTMRILAHFGDHLIAGGKRAPPLVHCRRWGGHVPESSRSAGADKQAEPAQCRWSLESADGIVPGRGYNSLRRESSARGQRAGCRQAPPQPGGWCLVRLPGSMMVPDGN